MMFCKHLCTKNTVMNKEIILSSKLSKKSPTLLWLVFLFTVMGFGIYICYLCLQQISIPLKPKEVSIKDIMKETCYIHDIPSQELQYVHFPYPKTYRRDLEVGGLRLCVTVTLM